MEIDLFRIIRRPTLNIAAILFSRKIPTDEEWWMICPDLCAYPGKLSSSNSIYWQSDVSPILIYISSLMEPFLCRLALGLKWHNLQRMICCYYCLLLLYSSATPLSLHDKLLYFHCERIDSSVHRVRFNFYARPINWSQVSLLTTRISIFSFEACNISRASSGHWGRLHCLSNPLQALPCKFKRARIRFPKVWLSCDGNVKNKINTNKSWSKLHRKI